MSWLLWVVVACALVVLLMAVPIQLDFRVDSAPTLGGEATIAWGGLVRFHQPLFAPPKRPGMTNKTKHSTKRTQSKRPRRRSEKRWRVHLSAASIAHIFAFFTRLLRQTRVQHLHFYARLGYGEPADTGMLFAALAPMHPLLDCYDVRVEPDFLDASFECEAEGRVVLTPLRYLAVVARFAVSPRTWRVLVYRS